MSTISNTFPLAEDTLIQQSMQGNLEAFNQLVLTYQNLAYEQACALLGDQALAEEATQQGFIKAFQGLRNFRGGSFRAWLLKIVVHSASEMLRQSKHQAASHVHAEGGGDPMEDLPEAYRRVITLVDIHDFDYQEAARALGIPVGSVKSQLARARLQIANSLREEGP
jgi:RNA polymerase sigma-70 factor (ECF subfamily)